jgi:hypothetical protein
MQYGSCNGRFQIPGHLVQNFLWCHIFSEMIEKKTEMNHRQSDFYGWYSIAFASNENLFRLSHQRDEMPGNLKMTTMYRIAFAYFQQVPRNPEVF